MSISLCNMQDSSTLFFSCVLRYLSACPPIVHAYIATNKLVVHACRSTSLSIVYSVGALLVYMNIRCYHACFRYFNACPPIAHAYIATILLIKHACMSISLSNMHVNGAF